MKSRKYFLVALLCIAGLAGYSASPHVPSDMSLTECKAALSDSWTGFAVFWAFVIGRLLGK